MSLIEISNLNKTFEGKQVLRNVNLKVDKRESLVIIGGSGSGKSVLLKCIAGLLIPDSGSEIFIDGENLSHHHILKRPNFTTHFAMLFQSNALFDSMSIWENITFGIDGISKMEAQKIAKEKLAMVQLNSDVLKMNPNEISGGMQKRVALARAIASNPKIIFFDEPTAGLDPSTSRSISKLIRDLCEQLNTTIITITHDNKCMATVADKVAVIDRGAISWHGTIDEALDEKNQFTAKFL